MEMIIDCDCRTMTRVARGEPLMCKSCGRKPAFRYTDKGFYRFEGIFYAAGVGVPEERKTDFLMFKRLLFQVRDKAFTEGSYLYFLAGYFGIIPTPEDLKVPEKGCFKIED